LEDDNNDWDKRYQRQKEGETPMVSNSLLLPREKRHVSFLALTLLRIER
jgi:hypothetical protein